MITKEDVQRVGFTAKPYVHVTGAQLTIDDLIKLTTSGDWDGDLYQLGDSAAEEIARSFNETHSLVVNGRRRPRLVK